MPSSPCRLCGTATSPTGLLGGHHSSNGTRSGADEWYGGYRANGFLLALLYDSGGRHPLGEKRKGAYPCFNWR